MPIPLVDLKAQYRSIKPELDDAMARVMESASFILGNEVEAFEAAFADYCETSHAIGVSSGTAALQLALLACGIGPGDEVITTAHTFVATAAAISHVGATPVFVDIDPDTYNMDPDGLEAAITACTRAIIPVHLYGQPAAMDRIMAVAREHDLRVIEDACQAVGATYNGRKVGSLGDAACFSFYPAKNLGAAGDGGMVVTRNDAIADRVRKLRDHGRTDHYGHALIGYTYRLDGLQAAILNVKLQHLDDWTAARREHAAAYSQALADTDLVLPTEAEGCRSVYHLYVVRTERRDELLQDLRAAGVGASIHYPLPVHLQPAYAQLGLKRGSYPVAEGCADQVLSLPLYPEMTAAQRETVVTTLKGLIGA
jgi:dTDP-4-amino-4,6-dideoxygalactose transaminase